MLSLLAEAVFYVLAGRGSVLCFCCWQRQRCLLLLLAGAAFSSNVAGRGSVLCSCLQRQSFVFLLLAEAALSVVAGRGNVL